MQRWSFRCRLETMPYFPSQKDQIYYEIDHPDRTPTLICLHGWGTNRTLWNDISAHLPAYRILKIDLPGMGLSSYSSAFSKQNYLFRSRDLVLALMDQLRIQNFSLLGHSIGGILAGQLALAKPPLHLILDSTPLLGATGVSIKVRLFGMARWIRSPLYASLQSRWITERLFRGTFENVDAVSKLCFSNLVEGARQACSQALYDSLRSSFSFSILEKLKPYSASLLYIIAANNRTLDQHCMLTAIRQSVSQIEVLKIPGAGHYSQLEQQIFYYKNVKAYLDRNYAS